MHIDELTVANLLAACKRFVGEFGPDYCECGGPLCPPDSPCDYCFARLAIIQAERTEATPCTPTN